MAQKKKFNLGKGLLNTSELIGKVIFWLSVIGIFYGIYYTSTEISKGNGIQENDIAGFIILIIIGIFGKLFPKIIKMIILWIEKNFFD